MKSVAIHAALAVVGLVLAYQTWTRPAESERPQASGQTVVLECNRDALTRIELDAKTRKVWVQPVQGKAGAPSYWITSVPKKSDVTNDPHAFLRGDAGAADAAMPPDGAAGADAAQALARTDAKDAGTKVAAAGDAGPQVGAEARTEPKPPRKRDPDAPRTFAANREFDDLMAWLAPLRADRDLGKLAEDQLAAFGFDEGHGALRLTCSGRELTLELGATTFGTSDRYARDAKSGEVYLLDGAKITDLESAQFKFMQTELHRFALEDIDKVTIRSAGEQRELLQRNRKVRDQAVWVDAAAPDRRNDLYGNWLQRLRGLRARAYLGAGEQPGADLQIAAKGSRELLTIEYEADGKPQGKLALVRVDTDQGGMYYARSEATERWVVLPESTSKQLEDDLPLVLGAEGAAPEKASTKAR